MDSQKGQDLDIAERELISAVKKRDASALRLLLDLELSSLRVYVALQAPIPGMIDEVTRDAFVAACSDAEAPGPRVSVTEWLRGIARRILRERLDALHTPEGCAAILYPYRRNAVRTAQSNLLEVVPLTRCLEQFTPALQNMLRARYAEHQSFEAIAEGTGDPSWSADRVRYTLFRLRGHLGRCLRRRGEEEEE